MPADLPTSRPRLSPLNLLVVLTAVLYFGRDLLMPLALAILLSFLLAPLVVRLERWRLGRVVATIIVAAFSFTVIGAVGWVAGSQLVGLAASLPEYRANINSKIDGLQTSPSGLIGKAATAIGELEADLKRTREASIEAPVRQPVPVEIQPEPMRPLQVIGEIVTPLLAPLGTAAAVIIFTILMLLQRQDLRDRVIRLGGQTHINVTTQALEEASRRVSRYLRMQLIINVSYGVPVGIALYLLGIPNAPLWGVLAILLRFIPYIGAWMAALFPVTLAFAIGDGWSLMIWTISVFVVLEVISNNIVEPWMYGASTGMSAFAILVTSLFWTLLWGVVGLLLATPLTVCVAVLGRHIPQLGFINVILGDEPVLEPHERFYQRLLARDEMEASEIAETYLREHSLLELYEKVFIPALDLAEQDRHRDALDEKRERYFFDAIRRIVEMIAERPLPEDEAVDAAKGSERPAPPRTPPPRPGVFILPARDEADDIAGLMLRDLLSPQSYDVVLLPRQTLVGEMIERLGERLPAVVCISAVPPFAAMHAGNLCKRLRARFPDLKILVGVWNAEEDMEKAKARLLGAGMDRMVTTLAQAEEQIREMSLVEALALQRDEAANQSTAEGYGTVASILAPLVGSEPARPASP